MTRMSCILETDLNLFYFFNPTDAFKKLISIFLATFFNMCFAFMRNLESLRMSQRFGLFVVGYDLKPAGGRGRSNRLPGFPFVCTVYATRLSTSYNDTS